MKRSEGPGTKTATRAAESTSAITFIVTPLSPTPSGANTSPGSLSYARISNTARKNTQCATRSASIQRSWKHDFRIPPVPGKSLLEVRTAQSKRRLLTPSSAPWGNSIDPASPISRALMTLRGPVFTRLVGTTSIRSRISRSPWWGPAPARFRSVPSWPKSLRTYPFFSAPQPGCSQTLTTTDRLRTASDGS